MMTSASLLHLKTYAALCGRFAVAVALNEIVLLIKS